MVFSLFLLLAWWRLLAGERHLVLHGGVERLVVDPGPNAEPLRPALVLPHVPPEEQIDLEFLPWQRLFAALVLGLVGPECDLDRASIVLQVVDAPVDFAAGGADIRVLRRDVAAVSLLEVSDE